MVVCESCELCRGRVEACGKQVYVACLTAPLQRLPGRQRKPLEKITDYSDDGVYQRWPVNHQGNGGKTHAGR